MLTEWRLVTVEGSINLSVTFFSAKRTTQSFPLRPRDVMLAVLTALKAYSE